jgi:hypothetical protein
MSEAPMNFLPRVDLCLHYGGMVLGIEFKVWRDGERTSVESARTASGKAIAVIRA